MLTNIRLNNGTTMDFDTEDLPLGNNLHPLLEVLKNSDISPQELFRVAHIYKAHYEECKTILEFIKTNHPDFISPVEQLAMALDLQHGIEIDCNAAPTSVLKGFAYLHKKDYTKALACFSKERFTFGMDLCNYYYGTPENIILRSLMHLRNMEYIEPSKDILRSLLEMKSIEFHTDERYSEYIKIKREVLEDALFGLRLVEIYNNPKNIDVLQRKAEDLISKGKYEQSRPILESLNINDKNYLLGKIEHLKGNYNEAKQFYKKCISAGQVNTRSYVLSKYANERIVQETPLTFKFDSQEFNDFNVFLKHKNNVELGDLNGCSEDMRNFIVINKGVSDNMESCIAKYESLVDNKYMEKYIAMNNLIYFENRRDYLFFRGSPRNGKSNTKKHIKAIKEAVEMAPPDAKEALLYNQAYLSLDVDLFDSLSLEQAKIMSAYLKQDVQNLTNLNLIELASCLKDKEGAIECLSNKSSLYSNLLLGKLYLDKYIEHKSNIDLSMAISYFTKETKSFYAANGLGVCLTFKNKLSEAIKVFSSVVVEHKCAHINLGNVYILKGEYEKGVLEHFRYSTDSIKNIILHLKEGLSLDMLIVAYKKGCTSLKETIFEKLILENRLEEAKDYKVANKKLKDLYEKKEKENLAKSEELKRKIEELEKYKKSKNIK
ncbi:hypothetical protein NGRA_2128 [Nosema granulosis]|uniref:Uncharacterized protein n=1 Tax=Nosema granulosis TaxID=83296 RepID=A0A9P6GX93_9MICR|nr:hypothetical protein NGRA_2128 [Nosema granulosis]